MLQAKVITKGLQVRDSFRDMSFIGFFLQELGKAVVVTMTSKLIFDSSRKESTATTERACESEDKTVSIELSLFWYR